MSDRVVVQVGTREDPERLNFLLLYTKREGERLGFGNTPEKYTWTPGLSGGVWSTLDQDTAFSWARTNGQVSIHDNVKYETMFEMVWQRKP